MSSGEWRRDRQTLSYCQQCCGGDGFRARRDDERSERQPRTVGGTGGVCARLLRGAWRGYPACRTTSLTGSSNRYTERPIDRTVIIDDVSDLRRQLPIALTRSYGRHEDGATTAYRVTGGKGLLCGRLPGRWFPIYYVGYRCVCVQIYEHGLSTYYYYYFQSSRPETSFTKIHEENIIDKPTATEIRTPYLYRVFRARGYCYSTYIECLLYISTTS